jgi:hypothetical protein
MPGAWCDHGHLVSGGAFCHSPVMQDRRTPAAGGIFLFLGPVIGALYGIGRGEPIQWMLYGFGAGVALAVIIWLVDKRRS